MASTTFAHQPVMLQEVLHWLAPRSGGVFVDGTLGGGGHAAELAARLRPGGRLIAIDRDPDALRAGAARLDALQLDDVHIDVVGANTADLPTVLDELNVAQADGVLLDLGVSSPQLDRPERGFTYREDAPLDMRMDPSQTLTAWQILNGRSEAELRRIIAEYGEERWAARIAKFIVARRAERPLQTTGELVEVIKAAVPAGARRQGPHPARRTFQALRIAVNDELGSLTRALEGAIERLKVGGRLVVISFHSLEDRIVKTVLRQEERGCVCPPSVPACQCGRVPRVRVLTRRPQTPTPSEIDGNPRSRSAKLRAAERVLPPGGEE